MRGYHWGAIFLMLFVGYMVGAYWPGPGLTIRGKISGVSGAVA